jgi:transcriptional regulator with XRE-family HTH domain
VNSEMNPLFAHFAHELKRLRVKRGWSQEALGNRIGFSGEMVSKVETRRNAPSPEFTDTLDRLGFPELEGLFTELLDAAGDWQFRTYADAEQNASIIRTANPLLVPGLLQTEGYIRAVHEAWRPVDGNSKVDASIAARLERQAILDRELPPSFGVVLDESVLYRPIGGPAVMRDQLARLLDMSERPRVSLQVLPAFFPPTSARTWDCSGRSLSSRFPMMRPVWSISRVSTAGKPQGTRRGWQESR